MPSLSPQDIFENPTWLKGTFVSQWNTLKWALFCAESTLAIQPDTASDQPGGASSRQHNQEVFSRLLGLSHEEISRLEHDEVLF